MDGGLSWRRILVMGRFSFLLLMMLLGGGVRLGVFLSHPSDWKTADPTIPDLKLTISNSSPHQQRKANDSHFSAQHIPLHPVPRPPTPISPCPPLLSLCRLSDCRRSESLIPVVTTSSGTRRRRLRRPGCSVKDFCHFCAKQ